MISQKHQKTGMRGFPRIISLKHYYIELYRVLIYKKHMQTYHLRYIFPKDFNFFYSRNGCTELGIGGHIEYPKYIHFFNYYLSNITILFIV